MKRKLKENNQNNIFSFVGHKKFEFKTYKDLELIEKPGHFS